MKAWPRLFHFNQADLDDVNGRYDDLGVLLSGRDADLSKVKGQLDEWSGPLGSLKTWLARQEEGQKKAAGNALPISAPLLTGLSEVLKFWRHVSLSLNICYVQNLWKIEVEIHGYHLP